MTGALQLYNTLSHAKERFEPIDPAHVRMYVCGPTVYDYAHIGNARPVVVFDVLYRLLKRLYPAARVTYVRNVTDIDDKINAAARTSGKTIAEITARTYQLYSDDMSAVGALQPDEEPRATQHVAEMIAMTEALIRRGHAYVAEGHVLFHVLSMPTYGHLSRRNRDELIAGARIDVAPYKRDPADFVLWKPSDPETPGWESPWGRGRPGWHIECSAMSARYLGETFDIHGGGVDLVFPHHENEAAQSLCAHGAPISRYWVHNGFLTVNGEKMSKSLGNFFTVRELLAKAPGEALRWFLLTGHYRQPLDFTEQALADARQTLDRFYGALRAAGAAAFGATGRNERDPVTLALADDLNTPLALSHLHEALSRLNVALREGNSAVIATAARELRAMADVLGVLQQDPEAWFRWTSAGAATISEPEIERMIGERLAARKARDFAAADRIRAALAEQGVVLEDKPGGRTEWRRAG
jgi:cysteinyl-tRNA synthetase